MASFIDDMESKLELFVSIHGRKPVNSQEFTDWCDHVDNNSQTISKGDLIKNMECLK
jgi:hypothetical protein